MNNIKELLDIIKELGGRASLDDICNNYQLKHSRVLFSNDKSIITNTLSSNNNVVELDNEGYWNILKNSINKNTTISSQKIDVFLNIILSHFPNGKYSVYNQTIKNKNWFGQKYYCISTPYLEKACDIIMNSKRCLIYSSIELKKLNRRFFKISDAKNEPRPYEYHVIGFNNIVPNKANSISVKDDFVKAYRGKKRKEYLFNKTYNIELWSIKNNKYKIYSAVKLDFPGEILSYAKKEPRPYRYVVNNSIEKIIIKKDIKEFI